MITSMQNEMSQMYEEAVKSFDTALRTSIKIQEELTRAWTDALGQMGPSEGADKRFQAVADQVLPAARSQAEQGLKVVEQCTQSTLELIKKAIAAEPPANIPQAQGQVQAMWEASATALRDNLRAVVDANTKVMTTWSQLAKKAVEEKAQATKPANK